MKTLMTETTSLGVRYRLQQRICLIREEEIIETPWGEVRIKIAKLPTGAKRFKPEFEDCRKIAVDSGLPLVEVYTKINAC